MVVRPGERLPEPGELVLEDRTRLGRVEALPEDAPFGYHRLQPRRRPRGARHHRAWPLPPAFRPARVGLGRAAGHDAIAAVVGHRRSRRPARARRLVAPGRRRVRHRQPAGRAEPDRRARAEPVLREHASLRQPARAAGRGASRRAGAGRACGGRPGAERRPPRRPPARDGAEDARAGADLGARRLRPRQPSRRGARRRVPPSSAGRCSACSPSGTGRAGSRGRRCSTSPMDRP